jgi:IS30 family transposase
MKLFNRINFRERVIIETRYCVDKKSMRSIALELNKSPSAISREISGKPRIGMGRYRATVANKKSETSRHQQGRNTKCFYEPLREYVVKKLKLGWSPEQISIRLPIEHPQDTDMRISYEAIYQHIYAQVHRGGHGYVKKDCEDLRVYLPRRHQRRQAKGFRKAQKTERKAGLPSIEDRPEMVDLRTEIGHWEDDFLVSKASKVCIKSTNERMSGIVFFGKTKDGTAQAGDLVLFEKLNQIPQKYRKTLTRDNGSENKAWQSVQAALGLSVYFAHPYHSWERGSNENCNGLLRRFFPKGTDWNTITDEQITQAEYLINSRPRKRLGGLTPYEFFYLKTGVALDS